jgi:hypothetical protein
VEQPIRGCAQPFLRNGGQVCAVKQIALLETRLERNRTENRRPHGKTDGSTEEALRHRRYGGMHTSPLDLPLLRIDTEHPTAGATAERVRLHSRLLRPLRICPQ